MEVVLLLARLILSLVFGVAGVAKLRDLAGSEKAIAGFGVPPRLARPLGMILPLAEIVVAVLLLPLSTAWFGALGSLALLLIFIGGIVYNMARGRAPDCHCFGQIHSEPVGWSTLIRNSVLAAIAGFVVVAGNKNPGASAFAWIREISPNGRIQLVFGTISTVLLFGIFLVLRQILRQQVALQRQIEVLQLTGGDGGAAERVMEFKEEAAPPLEGLPLGAPAPDFAVSDAQGRQIQFGQLLIPGKPLVLLFVSPTCAPCQALLPEIEGWRRELGDKLNFVFVSSGAARENLDKFGADKTVLLEKQSEVKSLYRAVWTPTAVFVNVNGTVGSKLAAGDNAIRELVENIRANLLSLNGNARKSFFITAHNGHSHGALIGEPAPDFSLPGLDVENLSLRDFRGDQVLLLFWGTTCGYCSQMLDDLKRWERNANGTKLLVIANDDADGLRAQNFGSAVALDKKFEAQQLFGVQGTPSGVLINSEGRIVSEVAAGANEVFALVGYKKN